MCQDYFECVSHGQADWVDRMVWSDLGSETTKLTMIRVGRIENARRTGYDHDRCARGCTALLTRRQINKRKAEGGGLFG